MAPDLRPSVKLRPVRVGLVSGIGDIVSASGKMSTKSDHAHPAGVSPIITPRLLMASDALRERANAGADPWQRNSTACGR